MHVLAVAVEVHQHAGQKLFRIFSDTTSLLQMWQCPDRQVFCNALVPAVLAMLMGYWSGLSDLPLSVAQWRMYTAAAGAFLGYCSCCCGDTWASEVGQLSEAEPRLITSLRPVRKVCDSCLHVVGTQKSGLLIQRLIFCACPVSLLLRVNRMQGTNGGVTLLGIAASAAGGIFMGVVFYLGSLISPGIQRSDILFAAANQQWILIPLGKLTLHTDEDKFLRGIQTVFNLSSIYDCM